MKKGMLAVLGCLSLVICQKASAIFTPGNIVVLQTSGTASKASSQAVLKEYTTAGTLVSTVNIPVTGPTPFQTAGIFGGSEGFLSTSTDGKFLVVGGYHNSTNVADITASLATSIPRAIGLIYPSGHYIEVDTSTIFFSANDMRGGISDGTNFWASGASNNNIDGINYMYPSADAALASGSSPAKAYGLRIFNGQMYYSTQKAGPANTASQLGIFAVGTGLPISGSITPTQIINTGTVIPEDFSFNAAGDICYIAINQNNAAGGIQKWTKSGSIWSLAYTLGTGIANTGAYGLVVNYSGSVPVIYATTFDAAGNRVIQITDNGTLGTAVITTIVAATTNIFFKGISFAPVASGTPLVNLDLSTDTASEAGVTAVTVTATTSAPVTGSQTVTVAVSGAGITAGDYSLSGSTITIPNGGTSGTATFTIVNDILGEGTETVNLALTSPTSGMVLGMRPSRKIIVTDNDGNNKPTIIVNTTTTTDLIDNKALTAPGPFTVSGVISDPNDPVRTQGIYLNITDPETPAPSLIVTVKSSNTSVVPTNGISIIGNDSVKLIKITPAGIGYSNITITAKDTADSTSYVIKYAASAASLSPANTIWHTGLSDASDAVWIDNDKYITGDDELNVLNTYSRKESGMPLNSFNYTSFLNLPDLVKPEVDVEAATRSAGFPYRVYWMGSMSNGKAPFDNKPNRDRIFAFDLGGSTNFSFTGYAALKSYIVAWGDSHGYDFTASTAAGMDSKLPTGFAAEGMVFGPDNTTLYIGMRTPLVPATARTKALIIPIQNFETWFNNGAPSGSPTFGSPIELNLGGKGIRDLIKIANDNYVIVAGNTGGSPVTGKLYKWTGKATDTVIAITSPATDTLNMEGAMPMYVNGQPSLTSLQVICDKGDDELYNDGIAAKDFGDLVLRKFRSDIITGIDLKIPTPPPVVSVPGIAGNKSSLSVYPNPANGPVNMSFFSKEGETYNLSITDINGRGIFEKAGTTVGGLNKLAVDLGTISKGFYIIHLASSSLNATEKLILE